MKEVEEKKNKTVINHWNRREYLVVDITDKEVTLRRSDGSEFTVAKYELQLSRRKTTIICLVLTIIIVLVVLMKG